MVEVSRREKESIAGLLRRFTRKAQQAGLLKEARKVRYHKRPASSFKKKKSALRRLEIRALRHKLLKAGIIEEGQDVPPQLKKKRK
ncbi:MAG: 30S ribosomal protein S21 [bacterium]|nr:30S ribosomal protein S21 [bacterium]